MKNKQFLSKHAKDLFLSQSIYELAAAYGIVLNNTDDLRQLLRLIERDLTDGTYMDFPYMR